ncbi:MAG: hypothetical protein P4L16_04335 [Chlamydiales bacterium]|nr:hypothetical protein [Chlamydiales bacterium]
MSSLPITRIDYPGSSTRDYEVFSEECRSAQCLDPVTAGEGSGSCDRVEQVATRELRPQYQPVRPLSSIVNMGGSRVPIRVNYAQRYENGEISYKQYAQYRQMLKYGEIYYAQTMQSWQGGKVSPEQYEQMIDNGVLRCALYYAQYVRAYSDKETTYVKLYEDGEINVAQYTQMYRDGEMNHMLCEQMHVDGKISFELCAKFRQMYIDGKISYGQYYAQYARSDVRECGRDYARYKEAYERMRSGRESCNTKTYSECYDSIRDTSYRIDMPSEFASALEIDIEEETTWKAISVPPLPFRDEGASQQRMESSICRAVEAEAHKENYRNLRPGQLVGGVAKCCILIGPNQSPHVKISNNFIINGLAFIVDQEQWQKLSWINRAGAYMDGLGIRLFEKIHDLFSSKVSEKQQALPFN